MFRDLHADHDVEPHLGVGVEAFLGSTAAEGVLLADGTTVPGDLFVVGVGVSPRIELAEAAGLKLDNGVVVDERLATSIPGIWAAGDVANAYHPVFDARIRLEHWSAALNQGPVAAKNMLGQKVAYQKIPYFFSDQYDLGMEYNGFAAHWDQVVYRGDRASREVIVFWLNEGVPLAGMNVNVWDVNQHVQALIGSRQRVDPNALADPDTPLDAIPTAEGIPGYRSQSPRLRAVDDPDGSASRLSRECSRSMRWLKPRVAKRRRPGHSRPRHRRRPARSRPKHRRRPPELCAPDRAGEARREPPVGPSRPDPRGVPGTQDRSASGCAEDGRSRAPLRRIHGRHWSDPADAPRAALTARAVRAHLHPGGRVSECAGKRSRQKRRGRAAEHPR